MTKHESTRRLNERDSELPYFQPSPFACPAPVGSLPSLTQEPDIHIRLSPYSTTPTALGSPGGSDGKTSSDAGGSRRGIQEEFGVKIDEARVTRETDPRIEKGVQPKSRAQTQMEGIDASLEKTRLQLWSLAIQFALTVSMGLSLHVTAILSRRNDN